MEEDFYKILSVHPEASHAEIVAEVRRLSRFYSIGNHGIPAKKQKAMLSRIMRASEILTDPIRRLEFDLQSGYRKHSTSQSRSDKLYFPQLKPSESIEQLKTVKIPGQLDMDKLEKSLSSVRRSSSRTKLEEKVDAENKRLSGSTYKRGKTKKTHSDSKPIKQAEEDNFTKNELSENVSPTDSLDNKQPTIKSFQWSKNKELKGKYELNLELKYALENKKKMSPGEFTKFHSDSVQVLPSRHTSRKRSGASETEITDYKSGSREYLTSLPFDVNNYTNDETGTTVATKTLAEKKTGTEELNYDSSPSIREVKMSDFNRISDMQQKQLYGNERVSQVKRLHELSTARKPAYAEQTNELNSRKIKDVNKKEIDEVIIRGDFKEPIYLIDEEKMELSFANLKTEAGSVIKIPNIVFPSKTKKFENEEDHSLEKIISDDEDDKNKNLHSVRSFTPNSLKSVTKLEEELLNNYETEVLKKKSFERKRLMNKHSNEDCMHELMVPLTLQIQNSQENQQTDPCLIPSRKYSASKRYDIKRVNSIKLIRDLCDHREAKASEYQREKALLLQHDKKGSYSTKLQNSVQLLEEASKRFSNGNIPSKPISENLKGDTLQSFEGESNFKTAAMNSHFSYEESHSETKVKDSSIDSLAQNISMIDSEIVESTKITDDKTKDNGTDSCILNHTFYKEDSYRKHNIGMAEVLPGTSQSICHDNYCQKTEGKRVSKIKFSKEEEIIPLKENSESYEIDAKHVDSLLLTRTRMSRRQTEPVLFSGTGEFHRNLSLPQDYYSCHDFQNALQLLKTIRTISKDNKMICECISNEEIEQISKDEWQDTKSDDREANVLPVETKPVIECLESTESHSFKNMEKEDPTANDDIFIPTEKTISKPFINKQTTSKEDERQFQKENLMHISDDEISVLNTHFSTVKEHEKNTSVWSKDPMSLEEEDEEPRLQSVSATTRLAGANIRTVYHFGPNTEFIEVFVNDDLKAKIVKDKKQDIFCNAMKHDDLPKGVQIFASTVIAANDCIITTEVSKREKRETIVVYKNDEILFRSGNTVLD